jgi:hypothetical protein
MQALLEYHVPFVQVLDKCLSASSNTARYQDQLLLTVFLLPSTCLIHLLYLFTVHFDVAPNLTMGCSHQFSHQPQVPSQGMGHWSAEYSTNNFRNVFSTLEVYLNASS